MLTRWDEPSFGQMIADRAAIPLCGKPNTTPLLHAYRVGEQRARRVAQELQHMLRRIGSDRSWSLPTDIVPAEIGNLGRDEVRLELDARHRNLLERIEAHFQRDLEDAVEAKLVGHIAWLGERACRFHYFEQERSRTLTTIRTRTVKHTHDLLDARKVRLPALGVTKPRKCREMIRAMPVWMVKHGYIVTGTQIVADVGQVAERKEPNELVTATRWMAGSAKRGAQVVLDRAAAAASIPLGISTAIRRDPGLVIGDYVLTGWEG